MADEQRTAPARPKKVEEINPKQDLKVRVTGTLVSVENDSVSLDDSTSTVEIFLEDDMIDGLEEGQRVRVFGRVLPTPDSFEIQGEIVQDFSNVDPELQNRVKKIVSTN